MPYIMKELAGLKFGEIQCGSGASTIEIIVGDPELYYLRKEIRRVTSLIRDGDWATVQTDHRDLKPLIDAIRSKV